MPTDHKATAEKAYTSWAHKHAAENPGHRAKEGLYDPGSCDDCAERSPIYNLSLPPVECCGICPDVCRIVAADERATPPARGAS